MLIKANIFCRMLANNCSPQIKLQLTRRHYPIINYFAPDTSEDKSESSYEDTTPMKRLNCPLCVNTFGYSFGLECHLLSVHQEDLQMIRDGKLTQQACGCLCCAAQFLKVDTLVRHILEEHKDFLMSSMHGKDFSDFDSDFQSNNQSANQSLRRHFDCQFCGQKFLRRHKKLFLVHLEQKHLQDLERFMHQSDMLLFNIENVENIEVKLLHNLSAKVRITNSNSSNSPNHQMQNNNADQRRTTAKRRSMSAQRVKSDRILDRSMSNDHQFIPADHQFINAYEKLKVSPPHHYEIIASPAAQENLTISTMKRIKKKLRRSESTSGQPRKMPQYYKHTSLVNKGTPAKIKLSTHQSFPQPEPPGNSEEDLSDNDKRTTSTYSTNSSEESCRPGGPPTNGNYFAGNLFKCNLCEIAFAENAFLLTHLKNRHRSTFCKALRPHFS